VHRNGVLKVAGGPSVAFFAQIAQSTTSVCGAGRDSVVVDREDLVGVVCERIMRVGE
jgi:hypothetical protein